MNKCIYDKNNGLWYELQGDYYIPCLTLPAEKENKPIGIWGQRHKPYLQEHRKITYTILLTSGKLNTYLNDIDEQAENQMLWVGRMENIRNQAMEIVNADLIFV